MVPKLLLIFCNLFDKVKIYYRAGYIEPDKTFEESMSGELERLLVFYALSLLDTELCGCNNTRNIWQYMSEDLAAITESKRFVVNWDDLRNPLGTTRAAILLWKHLQFLRKVRSPNVR